MLVYFDGGCSLVTFRLTETSDFTGRSGSRYVTGYHSPVRSWVRSPASTVVHTLAVRRRLLPVPWFYPHCISPQLFRTPFFRPTTDVDRAATTRLLSHMRLVHVASATCLKSPARNVQLVYMDKSLKAIRVLKDFLKKLNFPANLKLRCCNWMNEIRGH